MTMKSTRILFLTLLMGALSTASGAAQATGWQPKQGPLSTRWTAEVSPSSVHPEYPRPQMVREEWQSLNGLWQYAIRPTSASAPAERYDGEILVPFSITSALSGVMTEVGPENTLWYRRTFRVPDAWRSGRVLLHFGAVDWSAMVWVNGTRVGGHEGGYTPFSFDISPALTDSGDQELVVSVWDPTDAGFQPRGKQVRNPHGIWYTPTTGIWQTVWLEAVPDSYIESIRITPDLDAGAFRLSVTTQGASRPLTVRAEALDGDVVATTSSEPGGELELKIADPKLWSPDSPFLYDLRLTLVGAGRTIDTVRSYCGMRKISLGKGSDGILRLFLNGKPLFQYGPLDQGFWPDGIYTAPTDEALRHDIEVTKQLGFNMIRKHVKIEPDRWYYWTDKLGVLVWQDMPSGDAYIRPNQPDITRVAQSAYHYERELKELIDNRYNHPSIVMWVPFNEGWGQFDTGRLARWIGKYDPSRLVDSASGWADRGVGDVYDIHAYPGPRAPAIEPYRAIVLGEFGGLGLPLKGHTWQSEDNWGYRSFEDAQALTEAYLDLLEKLKPLIADRGLAAAVYTQTTDVEIEVNGLMTYDREIIKMDPAKVRQANEQLYEQMK
ncbi:MAG: sugar-binding domain-containing protein [Acidobacteriota bacterium]